MDKVTAVGIFIAASLLCISGARASHDICPGKGAGDVDFSHALEPYEEGAIYFESKAEEGTNQSNVFFWCVGNELENFVIKVNWGDQNKPEKFFSGYIEPGHQRVRQRSHFRGVHKAEHKYRFRKNFHSWNSGDIETVFYKNEDEGSGGEGTSADVELLTREIVEGLTAEYGKIQIISFGSFDIPISVQAQNALAQGEYNYVKSDFVTIGISVGSNIVPADGSFNLINFIESRFRNS